MLDRFRRPALAEALAMVPLDRVRAIAGSSAPHEYTSVGKSKKRERRQALFKQAIVVLGDGEQAPVVIRNLSQTGCRIEFGRNINPVGRLRLIEQSLALDVWGNVVWRGGGACGLVFEDSSQLLDTITALEAPAPNSSVTQSVPSGTKRKARSSIRKR
jgi:PilZ domain